MKRPRKMTVIFNPDSPFEVAKAISMALGDLPFSERMQALRWAAETRGFDYPVKIQGGANHP